MRGAPQPEGARPRISLTSGSLGVDLGLSNRPRNFLSSFPYFLSSDAAGWSLRFRAKAQVISASRSNDRCHAGVAISDLLNLTSGEVESANFPRRTKTRRIIP